MLAKELNVEFFSGCRSPIGTACLLVVGAPSLLNRSAHLPGATLLETFPVAPLAFSLRRGTSWTGVELDVSAVELHGSDS